MIPGELIEVLPHNIEGYTWTIGNIGSIIGPAHIANFSINDGMKVPSIWPYMWILQVEHKVAKGDYALASLPEKHLAPHTCVESCPNHFGIVRS